MTPASGKSEVVLTFTRARKGSKAVRARVLLLACIVGAGLVSSQPSYALAGQPLSAPPGPTPTKPGLGGPTASTSDSAENTQEAWQRRVIARLFSLSHTLP